MHKKTLSLKCGLYTQGGLDIEFGDQDLSKVLPILENLHWVMLGSAHRESPVSGRETSSAAITELAQDFRLF